jgi:AmiR/NasT family two-component response regulator
MKMTSVLKKKILIFQEYEGLNKLLKCSLSNVGYQNIYTVNQIEHFIPIYELLRPDVIILEVDSFHHCEMLFQLLRKPEFSLPISGLICIVEETNCRLKYIIEYLGIKQCIEKPIEIDKVILEVNSTINNIVDSV